MGMNIIINKDHLVYKHDLGDYHISPELLLEKGLELEDYILSELNLKQKAAYSNKTIDFKQARELGFCEYGIKDFCEQLDLDIDKEYTITELRGMLSLEVFAEYQTECLTLFGKGLYDKFGGIKGILETDSKYLNLVISSGLISDDILHNFGIKCAESVLYNFEKEYPNDKRPREAIEAKKKWLLGEITDEELEKFRLAADSAASAADSAADWAAYWAAASAADSAADWAASAASAAYSAAYWAAYWAADSAAKKDQAKLLITMLGENNE